MKKIFALALCLCMLFAFVACGDDDKTQDPAPEAPTTAEYKLGMGIVVDLNSSKGTTAQVDATVATVVLDKDGKIVLCRIDAVQNKYDFTKDDATKTFQTKMEQGDAYNMAPAVNYGPNYDPNGDGIVKEWYDQAKAFEKHVVGMTGEQVANMATATNSLGYQMTTDTDLLAAGCTIQITDFKAAVAKACNDEQGMTFTAVPGSFTLGVAASSTAADSTAEVIKMDSDFACAVVVDGKIVATLNDAIQTEIKVVEGALGDKTLAGNGTKRERKEGYNMSTFGASMDPNGDGRVLEWYLQSEAFSKHVVGMTGEQVANMATATNSIGYQMTTDTDLLAAGCTIQITAIKAVVAKSVTNAR